MSVCKSIGYEVFRLNYMCKCTCHEIKTTTVVPYFKWRTNGTPKAMPKTFSPPLYHIVGTLSPPPGSMIENTTTSTVKTDYQPGHLYTKPTTDETIDEATSTINETSISQNETVGNETDTTHTTENISNITETTISQNGKVVNETETAITTESNADTTEATISQNETEVNKTDTEITTEGNANNVNQEQNNKT